MASILEQAISAIFDYLTIIIFGIRDFLFPGGRPSLYGFLLLIALTLLFIELIFNVFWHRKGDDNE